MIALLDVKVLVPPLFDPIHTHHDSAHRWFERERASGWATCPITENGLVGVLSLCDNDRVQLAGIGSPHKVTDRYLLALAVQNGGRLATFDGGFSPSSVENAEEQNLTLID